jgi:putative tricarboxylic transport membrane protein
MTTMVSFDNDWTVFFTRPISGTILALSVVGLLWPVGRAAWARYRKANLDEQPGTP